jgi:hydrogenase expression/formation protein HypC
MCVTYPGQVIGVVDGMAEVLIQGQRRRASLVVAPEVAVGDWVIVAAGTVLEIVEPDDAAEILALLGPADQPKEG